MDMIRSFYCVVQPVCKRILRCRATGFGVSGLVPFELACARKSPKLRAVLLGISACAVSRQALFPVPPLLT